MPSIGITTNLNNGTQRKPEIIAAIAPFSDNPFQNKDRIITGQKVAAIPDQPNITIQKTVRSGDILAMIKAITSANKDMISVTHREIFVKSLSFKVG